MNKPLALSLIIPAYNEEEHLKACLDSVAAQTRMPNEVIVVDNNSTDATRHIAESYPFVRVVNARQQGIVHARNAGFNAAKYGLIGRIDADSVLPPEWAAYIHEFYAVPGRQMTSLTGGGKHYNTPLPNVSRWLLDILAFRMNRIVLGHHFLFGSNMVLPRTVWLKVQDKICLRNDIHEDVDIAIHIHRLGFPIVYRYKHLVGVKLRRVFQDHNKFWGVLMLWPQTLRVHKNPLWITGWLGAIALYCLTPLIYPLKGLQLLRQRIYRKSR
jgi:glycosyltransferase involved in cell wall biosynthesis